MADQLETLPPVGNLETHRVLKQLIRSHKALAELKGLAETMPNKHILINAIMINEAKDSSAIENIVTTHDELFKAMSQPDYPNLAAKEVVNYRSALWHGYEAVKERQLLTTNMISDIQEIIEQNRAGIRKLPGTVLHNPMTGHVVYRPPEGEQTILALMANLEQYIHDDYDGVDFLVKLAVIHFQFESIHPFYDGNGRTGRILNVLYLVLKDLLDSPILYLSRYIIRNKASYYRLLQEVRTKQSWEEWILYILAGIEEIAEETLTLVKRISGVVEETADAIRLALPKIYSRDLLNALFFEFYTKISFVSEALQVSRKTASGYLMSLEAAGFLQSYKLGKEKIYLNRRLFDLVKDIGSLG